MHSQVNAMLACIRNLSISHTTHKIYKKSEERAHIFYYF